MLDKIEALLFSQELVPGTQISVVVLWTDWEAAEPIPALSHLPRREQLREWARLRRWGTRDTPHGDRLVIVRDGPPARPGTPLSLIQLVLRND